MFKIKKDFGKLIAKFSIRLPILRKVLRLVNKLVDICYIYFKFDSIVFDTMDGSHIGLIYARVDKTLCQSYEYFNSDPMRFFALPMYIKLLRQMVDKIPYRETNKKRVGVNEIIEIEGYENGLRVVLNNKKGSIYIRSSEDLDTEKTINGEGDTLVKTPSDYEFTMNSLDFQNHLNIIDLCTEVCVIGTNGNIMYAMGDGVNGAFEQEICENPTKLNSDIFSDIQTHFAVQYLKKLFNKEIGNIPVKFLFAKEHPLVLEIPLGDKSLIRWYLAPRVEEDYGND